FLDQWSRLTRGPDEGEPWRSNGTPTRRGSRPRSPWRPPRQSARSTKWPASSTSPDADPRLEDAVTSLMVKKPLPLSIQGGGGFYVFNRMLTEKKLDSSGDCRLDPGLVPRSGGPDAGRVRVAERPEDPGPDPPQGTRGPHLRPSWAFGPRTRPA